MSKIKTAVLTVITATSFSAAGVFQAAARGASASGNQTKIRRAIISSETKAIAAATNQTNATKSNMPTMISSASASAQRIHRRRASELQFFDGQLRFEKQPRIKARRAF